MIECFEGLELRLWILDSGLSIFPLDIADLDRLQKVFSQIFFCE